MCNHHNRENTPASFTALLAAALLSVPASGFPASAPAGENHPADTVPKLACDQASYHFGKIANTGRVDHLFELKNEGGAQLTIGHIRTGCGCTTVKLGTNNILPGGMTELEISFDLRGRRGAQRKSIYVHNNDPARPVFKLELIGEALSAGSGMDIEMPPVTVGAQAGDGSLQADKKETATAVSREAADDIYSIPKELIFISAGVKTNPVARYLTIRSRSGGEFAIQKIDPPDPRMTVNCAPIFSGGYRLALSNILPRVELNGQGIIITIDAAAGKRLAIPCRVIPAPP